MNHEQTGRKIKKSTIVIIVLVAIGLIGALASQGGKDDNSVKAVSSAPPSAVQAAAPVSSTPEKVEPVKTDPPAVSEPEIVSEPPAPVDTVTAGQRNALKSANQYLSVMAFSHSGLIEQLEYDQYSNEDATYAADNCGADWNEQAAKSAQQYLDLMGFSRDGLIEQLIYDGYTDEQAAYGADAAGL